MTIAVILPTKFVSHEKARKAAKDFCSVLVSTPIYLISNVANVAMDEYVPNFQSLDSILVGRGKTEFFSDLISML